MKTVEALLDSIQKMPQTATYKIPIALADAPETSPVAGDTPDCREEEKKMKASRLASTHDENEAEENDHPINIIDLTWSDEEPDGENVRECESEAAPQPQPEPKTPSAAPSTHIARAWMMIQDNGRKAKFHATAEAAASTQPKLKIDKKNSAKS
jgi:hypothetical protein